MKHTNKHKAKTDVLTISPITAKTLKQVRAHTKVVAMIAITSELQNGRCVEINPAALIWN